MNYSFILITSRVDVDLWRTNDCGVYPCLGCRACCPGRGIRDRDHDHGDRAGPGADQDDGSGKL